MNRPLVDRIPFAKIVTVLAIIFGIALGLCGLNGVLMAIIKSNEEFGAPLLVTTGIVEIGGMLLSGVCLVLTVIAWVILSAVGSFSRSGAEPQKLFDEESNTGSKDEL
jgi:hypothetical protein